MRNNQINLTAGPAAPGGLTPDVRNTSLLPVNAVNQAKAVYYIEDASIDGQRVMIDYTLNDTWLSDTIGLPELIHYVECNRLHDYCFDSSDHRGEHVQASGSIAIDLYLSENLNYAVKAYLKAGKVGQFNVN